jgi:hypothetical protein
VFIEVLSCNRKEIIVIYPILSSTLWGAFGIGGVSNRYYGDTDF